jgi:2-polyprenyl-3-methyl-5-hydroxy-6-metoxy-1,4-benzoquinol methylase
MGQDETVVTRAKRLYRSAPPVTRILQSARPFICPFDDLLGAIPPTAHVLDVGCGAGLLLGLIADRHPKSSGVGFDSSGSAIAAAQRMAVNSGFNGRITFEQRAVGEVWPKGPFDVVSLVDVLHHIPPEYQREVVEQSFGYVRPGGILVYKDMAQRPFFSALWNRAHDLVLARQWIHYCAITEVEAWLRALGAEIVKTEGRSMGPYAHEWIIAKCPDTVAANA